MPLGNRKSMTPEEEMEALENQTRYFKDALREINKRIRELKAIKCEAEKKTKTSGE
jgi:hypothetical protein